MLNNGVNVIVSEDRDFDRVNTVKRVWLDNE
jgi:predicted nucleic acid-binding protein